MINNNNLEQLNIEDISVNASPAYEADDGMITDEQIEAIKKIVPQRNFDSAESLC
jgi:hypothetical protein